jgi:type VI secretion system secreted protein VgrG
MSEADTTLVRASAPALTSRFLELNTALGSPRLLAECVRVEEGLSQGFALHITALSTDAAIPFKSLIGQPLLLELPAAGNACARAFHGYITGAELSGTSGGFARYRLLAEPWTALLDQTGDSRVFQNMTVFDILDVVFARYQARGRLSPAWRYDVRDRAAYPRRSRTTQFMESDLAFAERLMLDEGLVYFFEHSADPTALGRGSHELVVADHDGSFKPNAQTTVRFTQPGAVMKEDSIDRWRGEAAPQANAIEICSGDLHQRRKRSVPHRRAHATAA